MRFMLKVNIPVETGNEAAMDGTLGSTIHSILEDLKPEAAYFTNDSGERTGILIVNISDSSEIPAMCEPWFLAFSASVDLHAVMVPEDLAKAGPSIARAIKKYT